MPTNHKNNPDAIGANPSIDNAGLSISPLINDSNIAGASYSPTADPDLSVSPGSTNSPAFSKNVNAQMVTHLYSRVSRWISENPALAIGATVGIVAAVISIAFANQSSRRRNVNADADPSGETYGNPYGGESGTYNPSTQTESIDRGGNYTSSGSDSYTGYDSAIGGNTGL